MALDNFFEVKKAKLRLTPRSATSPTLATPSQCVNGDAGMIASNTTEPRSIVNATMSSLTPLFAHQKCAARYVDRVTQQADQLGGLAAAKKVPKAK